MSHLGNLRQRRCVPTCRLWAALRPPTHRRCCIDICVHPVIHSPQSFFIVISEHHLWCLSKPTRVRPRWRGGIDPKWHHSSREKKLAARFCVFFNNCCEMQTYSLSWVHHICRHSNTAKHVMYSFYPVLSLSLGRERDLYLFLHVLVYVLSAKRHCYNTERTGRVSFSHVFHFHFTYVFKWPCCISSVDPPPPILKMYLALITFAEELMPSSYIWGRIQEIFLPKIHG